MVTRSPTAAAEDPFEKHFVFIDNDVIIFLLKLLIRRINKVTSKELSEHILFAL